MSNEEFQKLVLEGLSELKKDMVYIKTKIDIVEKQIKELSEFRQAIDLSPWDKL